MILERFLNRCWRGFWRGFGEVFGEVLERFLEITLISLSYYFAYHVGKDLVRDLEGIWTDFGMIGMTYHSFLRVFGGHAVMILLLFKRKRCDRNVLALQFRKRCSLLI